MEKEKKKIPKYERKENHMGGKGSGRKPGTVPHPNSMKALRENSPITQNADPTNVNPSTNERVIAFNREIFHLPEIDTRDPEQVTQRMDEFLDLCEKYQIRPMLNAMSSALGMSRQAFQQIATNQDNGSKRVTPTTRGLLKKMYEFLQNSYEAYLTEETGNPVRWFFLGKNYYHYRDQAERININVDASKQLPDSKEVANKYLNQVKAAPLPAEVVKVEDAKD